jgi:hypothetical protein
MSTTFPFNSPFDLAEFSMIGGSYQELVFAVYDENGNAVSLSGATINWYLSYYGNSVAMVTKSGVSGSSTNQFKINLDATDTLSLSGKFVQQYSILDSSGSTHRPSQGLINIFPALA